MRSHDNGSIFVMDLLLKECVCRQSETLSSVLEFILMVQTVSEVASGRLLPDNRASGETTQGEISSIT